MSTDDPNFRATVKLLSRHMPRDRATELALKELQETRDGTDRFIHGGFRRLFVARGMSIDEATEFARYDRG